MSQERVIFEGCLLPLIHFRVQPQKLHIHREVRISHLLHDVLLYHMELLRMPDAREGDVWGERLT